MVAQTSEAKRIFLEAAELGSPDAWGPFLDSACRGDAALRERVELLLKAHVQSNALLDGNGVVATIARGVTEQPGTQIGRYKLLEQIGEGGMGIVFVAEQTEPVRRRVALKIIKPGMDSKQVIARFEAERQALAMMDHPNIAKIFDAGTTGSQKDEGGRMKAEAEATFSSFIPHPSPFSCGRPYFVMELVRGMPITEYCDKARLSPRHLLELFVDVCQAVQHAHQKGIIHRDLKPSNVMVTLHDGMPVVKVIDFGVAKAVGQQLTERTVYTALTQLVGTPLYMSPEQAEMSGLDVDTRSDVYSLGVLLYELLTGQTPFDKETLSKVGLDEMRRIIREDEPETISTRLARTRRAGARGSGLGVEGPPSSSLPLVPNPEPRIPRISELDWIVMKSLEKDRSRRYESASALATDIQRYLSDEPVLACPPSTMYRFQKFARKHKPSLITAAAIAACLLLGTTVSAWQAVRATTAEAQANANANQAEEKAKEATEQRDEAQRQRDEVKALADKLAAKEQQLQRTLYAAHMNLAHNAFEAGAPGRLRELLAQHRPQPGEADLRGFEWHYLNRLFPADLLVLEHTSMVRSVAYSPDGKRLATRSQDGTVSVWDAQTGDKLFSRQGIAAGGFDTVTFSPDGKRVASSTGGGAKIWHADTGQELLSLPVSLPEGIQSLGATTLLPTFSLDGKRLATGSVSGQMAMWDAQTGQQLFTLEGHSGQIRGLAFSPDGKHLASASIEKTVKLWDAESGQILRTFEGHGGSVFGVAYSPDGKRLASASVDKTVKLWDALSGEEIRTLRGHTGVVYGIAFSPDGKRLASASEDSTVKVWDVESGEELFALREHTRPVWSVSFTPDGQRLASASEDGTVKVREAKIVRKALVLGGGATDVTRVTFSPDGKRLTSVNGRGRGFEPAPAKAQVWDTHTGEKLRAIDAGNADAALSLDGRRLAGSSYRLVERIIREEEANIWDLLTGEKLLTIPNIGGPSYHFALSPDGNRLFTTRPPSIGSFPGGSGRRATAGRLWDAKTGHEILSLKGPVGNMVFSPDGKRLAGIAEDKAFKLWDAQSGDEILTLKGLAGSVAFSSDGKRLTGRSDDATVAKIWDAQTGEELLSLKGHSGAVNSAAFSPDSKRLATSSSDATIKLWDGQSGQELLTLAGHSGRFNGVAFSPEGNRLAAGGPNGTVMIYDATPLPEL